MAEIYTLIGAMSGTSLDGLDLACCRFTFEDGSWSYAIEAAETKPYTDEWQNRLVGLKASTALQFVQADHALGKWIGQQAKAFVKVNRLKPEALAAHGHTIFHQPEEGFTIQIGNGFSMMVNSGLPVINDFRSLDVALGGHGAPLVPIGDALLFGDYNLCLNLGGIANITANSPSSRLAFDICPANMALNYLAHQLGFDYDDDGQLAASGTADEELLQKLNALTYYRQPAPKSLGAEWVEAHFLPLLDASSLSVADKLRTICVHIAHQIMLSVTDLNRQQQQKGRQKMLVTGGGAFNKFLISLLEQYLQTFQIEVKVPDPQTVAFKEALIFAFLGALRLRREPNSLQSVTGARQDNCGGVIYDNIF